MNGARITLASNLAAIIGSTPGVRDGVEDAATQILNAAKALVPVRSGALRDSGRVELTIGRDGVPYADVRFGGGGVDYAVYVEFGTYKDPAQLFLTRAADAATR